MPLLDTQKVWRGLRACMILGLAWEILHTVKYPWHSEQQADAYFTPAWRLNAVLGDASNKSETLDLIHPRQYTKTGIPIYASTKLLRRCQSAMRYNISSSQYETVPMSVWSSVEDIIASDPAAAWATWQEIFWTAKNPWGAYWARSIALLSWHIMPARMLEHLELLEEAVPVLIADPPRAAVRANHAQQGNNNTSIGAAQNASDQQQQTTTAAAAAAWWDTAAEAELATAVTLAAVNGSAAGGDYGQDAKLAAELGNVTDGDDSNSSGADDDSYRVVSRWVAHCNASVNSNTLKPVNRVFCTVTERSNATHLGGYFHITSSGHGNLAAAAEASEARLFGVGPLASVLQGIVHWLDQRTAGWAGLAVHITAALWHLAVPFGSIRVLHSLMRYLAILELEYEWAVLLTYSIVVLAVFRSWLYLVCVAYKVLRRLQLLAFHNIRDMFMGTMLTIFGMILGMWQNMGYGMMDLAIDVLIMKFMMSGLDASDNAAVYVWSVSFEWGVFELRALMRCYKLAKGAWNDVKSLVMDPQAIVLQQPAILEQRKNKVNTIGPWPPPLSIPDEIDDLPNSDIPRGFICPITQAIMRQPALLLHDQTITPSSYEKDAISEWLATHSTDPKTPGRHLQMKTVKLVYNGDLARAIEDWASQTLQRTASQQRQFAFMQQFRVRAQEALFQTQQQQPGGRAAVPGQTEGPDPFADAAAAVGTEGARLPRLPAEGPAAEERGDTWNRHGSGVAGTATNLMRQSSAAIATVASLDIPSVATAGLAALADTTRRITTRAAARRLAQQQQHQHHAAAAAGGGSSSSDGEGNESPLMSPLQSPRAAKGTGAAGSASHLPKTASRSSPDVSPGEGRHPIRGNDSDFEDQLPRRSLRVRRRTATPALE